MDYYIFLLGIGNEDFVISFDYIIKKTNPYKCQIRGVNLIWKQWRKSLSKDVPLLNSYPSFYYYFLLILNYFFLSGRYM